MHYDWPVGKQRAWRVFSDRTREARREGYRVVRIELRRHDTAGGVEILNQEEAPWHST
jgi:hypothetical protein